MSTVGSEIDPPHVAARRLRQIIESRFADGLEQARMPAAPGPGAEAEALREAYLGLLKLALCDLVGTTTTSVERAVGGAVMSRELAGDDLRFRAAGLDWPLHGLSMVGLARLDDLQRCVDTVVADGIAGDLIECGSWRGGAAMLMRATLDSLGASERSVFAADSFQGFPAAQAGEGYNLDADLAGVGFLAVPLEEVRASFQRLGLERGVTFVPGFFADTLPTLRGHPWALARLDGDSYDATRSALDAVYSSLAVGGYLVIDDFYPLDDCRRAVEDFRAEHGITEPIEAVDWNAARWRRASAAGPPSVPETAGTVPEPVARPVQEPTRVPTTEEVALRYELSLVRDRLAAAEQEITRLTGAPLAGTKEWLKRRLRNIEAAR
ncbi:MAG TPA: TylF/MycF/NovP-related O-methyltransferase [Solirubrobacteraceae bacterium]|nr:TylF/MycF/NovP-related O-methyltransferase [Solirubrobacteraceae bacterium]